MRRLRVLRFIPGLPLCFDGALRTAAALFRPTLAAAVETVERTVCGWPGVSVRLHRFGGTEFRFGGKELGHLHGSGVLDIPLTHALRAQLVSEKRAVLHHVYPRSHWVTFYLRDGNDVPRALSLLHLAYERRRAAGIIDPHGRLTAVEKHGA